MIENTTPAARSLTGAGLPASQQVSFAAVTEFVDAQLVTAVISSWPMIGSPAWTILDDNDPVKWAAILDAARHWALRVETAQTAMADASREISTMAPWSTVGRGRGPRYIPRRRKETA